MAGTLLSSLVIGGNVALSILGNLILIPLALYYLLVDWQRFTRAIYSLVPRRMRESVAGFVQEADIVLSQYLRGQLVGDDHHGGILQRWVDAVRAGSGAWPIGIFTGLAYVCALRWLCHGTGHGCVGRHHADGIFKGGRHGGGCIWNRPGTGKFLSHSAACGRAHIGLHPLMVIFALLAFGQLFGFVGVLLALPASAVLLVAVRRLRNQYLHSSLYKG